MNEPLDIAIGKVKTWAQNCKTDADLSGDELLASHYQTVVGIVELVVSLRRLTTLLEQRITDLSSENARLESLVFNR